MKQFVVAVMLLLAVGCAPVSIMKPQDVVSGLDRADRDAPALVEKLEVAFAQWEEIKQTLALMGNLGLIPKEAIGGLILLYDPQMYYMSKAKVALTEGRFEEASKYLSIVADEQEQLIAVIKKIAAAAKEENRKRNEF